MIAMADDIIAQAVRMFYRTEGAGRVGAIAVANLMAAGYRIIGPDELVRVRSDAIREFCANAKIAPSAEADSLPNDVRQFRLEAAVDARRLIRSLKKEGGGG